MLEPEEAHVVERHAPRPEQRPRRRLIVGVLHGEIHAGVILHRLNQVAHDVGGWEAGLVLVGRPEHPHRLMAFVFAWKYPLVMVLRGRAFERAHAVGDARRQTGDDDKGGQQNDSHDGNLRRWQTPAPAHPSITRSGARTGHGTFDPSRARRICPTEGL